MKKKSAATVTIAFGLVMITLGGATTPNPLTSTTVNSDTTEHWPLCNYTRNNLISGKSLISLVTFNNEKQLLLYDAEFCGYKADTDFVPFGQSFDTNQFCLDISQQGMYPPPSYLVRNTSVCKDSSSAFLFMYPKVVEQSIFGWKAMYRVVTVCTNEKKTYLQSSLILNAAGLDATVPDPEGVQVVDYWLETNEMVFSTWVPLEEEGDPRKIILFGMANKNNRACFFKMTVEAFGKNMSTFRVSKVPTNFCIDAPSPIRRGFELPETLRDILSSKDEMIFYAFDGHNDVIKLYFNQNEGARKADSLGDQKADKFFVCDNPPDILLTEEPDDFVEKESGLSLPAILAITLACILFLIIVVFLVHYCCRSGDSSEEKIEGQKGEAPSVKSTKADKVKSLPVKSSIIMASKNSSSAKSPKGSSIAGKSKAIPSELAKSKVTSDLGNKSADKKSSKASSSQAKSSSHAKSSSSKEN